jgi:Dolichyl-phosphate-mannose-protein mannosyltransferase
MRFRSFTIVLGLACLLYGCLAFWMAWNSPPGMDEGWFANPAYRFINYGDLGTTILDPHGYIFRPEFTGLEKRTYWVLPANILLQAAWYELVGFSLLSMRSLSVLWGIGLIVSMFCIAKRLTNDTAIATLTSCLLSTDLALTQYGGAGRMDMMCLSLGIGAQAVYLSLRERHRGAALLVSHLLTAVAGLTHPNFIFPLAGLLALMIHDAFASRRSGQGWGVKFTDVLYVAIPYVLAAALYGLYISQDLRAFQAQIAANNVQGSRTQYLQHPIRAIGEEIGRYRTYYGLVASANPAAWLKSLPLFCLLVGFFGMLLRGSRLILLLTLIPIVGLTFFNYKNLYYLIFAIPYLTLAASCFYVEQWRQGGWKRWAIAGVLGSVVVINLTGDIRRGFQVRTLADEYTTIVSLVTPQLPKEGKIMASPQFAFLFGFDRTVQDDTMGYFSGKQWDVMVEYRFTDEEWDNIQRRTPEIAKYRQTLLAESFTEIFHGPSTSVYLRNH